MFGAFIVSNSKHFWSLKFSFYLVSNINGHYRHSQLTLWDKALLSADPSRALKRAGHLHK